MTDYYSITSNHYLKAGRAGIDHFHFLLSVLIEDVNNVKLRELNTAYAHILYKSHGKNRNLDRSYRLISSCPLLSKLIDMYVRELELEK